MEFAKLYECTKWGGEVVIRRKSKIVDFILLLSIKYMYIIISVTTLEGLWYGGSNGYMIDFNLGKEIIASLIFFVMTILLLNVRTKKTFIQSFLRIFYVLYYIPLNSAYAIHSMNEKFLIWSTVFVLLILLPYIVRFTFKNRTIRLNETNVLREDFEPKKFLNRPLVHVFCVVICLLYILYKLLYNGFSFSLSIDADSVYTARDDYVESLLQIEGTPIAYLLTIVKNLAGVVVPAYLYIGLSQKKIPAIILSIFTLLCIFSVSSGKGSLFFVLIVIGIYILERWNLIKYFDRIFLLGIVALFVLSIIEGGFASTGRSEVYFVVLRREMFLPSWLNTLYFDYFSQHSKLWWSESAFLLQMFMPTQYATGPLQIISNTYFQGVVASPNTGFFAEAVMQGGFIGILIYPILYRLFVEFAANTYSKYGETLSIILAARMVISLTNVPMLRTDFMLGYMLLTFAMYLIPKIVIRK